MFSFLFDTFINLYLGLVVSYIRDLNPQYNFSITASWWGSMLANSFQVQISPRFYTQTLWHKQFWDFLSVFSIGSMVSGQLCFSVNQRKGQIITEYLAVLVKSRIECELHIQVLIFWLRKASCLEPRLFFYELRSKPAEMTEWASPFEKHPPPVKILS